MWMILQAKKAEDWVIATGETTSIRDFIKMAFSFIDVEIEFVGEGLFEKGLVKSSKNKKYQIEIGKEVVNVDSKYFRPTEVDLLVGDATKAKEKLGWEAKTPLRDLVKEMMESDLKLFEKDKYIKEGGHDPLNSYE
jgi:GDP-D-mannose dehydratase